MTIEERPDQFTNTRKADFNSIYNQPDPRAYFNALTPLQYQIPQQALPVVERILELSAPSEGGGDVKPRKVLDVCCSPSDPSLSLREGLRDVELVVCTGGVGYVGANTFSRIANAAEYSSKLWMATFVLRVFSFDEIVDILEEKHGLVTEKVPGQLFRQRRFTSREEQNAAVADVRARGLDTKGLEEDGWFYAECYVTRPRDAATPSW
ncbi:methyltransferase type 12 [Colletotrichum kahawae]|uniref:Methyltransferase type 12 n=1 Tax=Colletotrichum kahawae TaxID=34407 RepID=A0AAE0D6P6_COLKA|nr:methyltransferase type 12 [Colletotrichum kahawae]